MPNETSSQTPNQTRGAEAQAIIDAVRLYQPHQTVQAKAADETPVSLVLHQRDLAVIDVEQLADKLRERPRRRSGAHKVTDLASFIALANRFKDDDSVIFACSDAAKPSLTAIFDFHQGGPQIIGGPDNLARHSEHSTSYAFPLSKEWQAWHGANKKVMTQQDFAAFIEDRIADVAMPDPVLTSALDQRVAGGDFGQKTQVEELAELLLRLNAKLATPAELVNLSRGLAVYENAVAKNVINLTSGEAQVVFETAHVNEQGEPLSVPGFFLIAIPIFEMGAFYQIAVRLRYRKMGGALAWFYELYRVERVFDYAFNEACATAAMETALPLFLGSVK